ncbi:MAG: ABC transporter permease [Chloroflexi bacterium]|nr:ABC transporter permease [Chloroflexota bacterium]
MARSTGVARLAETAEERTVGKSLWVLGWERFRRKKLAMISLVIILAFYLGGIAGPFFAPFSYSAQNLDLSYQPAWLAQPLCTVINVLDASRRPPQHQPSVDHLLGTDRLGRDLFSRILWGMRTSVIVSLAAVLTGSIFLGVLLGALSGFVGRWVDTLIMRVGEIFLAFPGLLLVILISATLRPRVQQWVEGVQQAGGFSGLVESGFVDYLVVFGAMAAFSWVGVARIIRGQILMLRALEYVQAARAIGATTSRLIFVHILPNTLNIIIIMLSSSLGGAIGSELVLSWLGVGIQPPTPSLGVMIWENQSQTLLFEQFACRVSPVFLAPIFIVSVVFFCFALFGDGLNDALNPRAR